MIRSIRAVGRGPDLGGSGDLSAGSRVLTATPYSFRTHFERATFAVIAKAAERYCPVSRVLEAEITLEATLDAVSP